MPGRVNHCVKQCITMHVICWEKPKFPENGSCETILERWYKDAKNKSRCLRKVGQKSKSDNTTHLPWKIILMKIHLSTKGRWQRSWTIVLNKEGLQVSIGQRPDFREAKHAYRRLHKEHVESTGQGNKSRTKSEHPGRSANAGWSTSEVLRTDVLLIGFDHERKCPICWRIQRSRGMASGTQQICLRHTESSVCFRNCGLPTGPFLRKSQNTFQILFTTEKYFFKYISITENYTPARKAKWLFYSPDVKFQFYRQ